MRKYLSVRDLLTQVEHSPCEAQEVVQIFFPIVLLRQNVPNNI